MLRDTLGYFNTTPPIEWCFVEFYKYRKQQTNFKKSFDLEAFNLQKALIHLSEKGTTEEKEYAVKLSSTLKICDWVKNGWGAHQDYEEFFRENL
ncbi:hypothetical protein BC937DRAFT_87273 [Endogone sp. FLAS-F59071]|nr:hypothetical protein BC937DRAFT_87273 [Endogone sp. FLAS-F59071]|eukprot:RUS19567.1 hypothetical protein BC937DRAFT_87273 [Endogone sp. FLAS-F59071]